MTAKQSTHEGSWAGDGSPIRIFDATPPADFPSQVIVTQDQYFIDRNPGAAYYLRVKVSDVRVETHQLPGAVGPAHARRMAREKGFDPTHWTSAGQGIAHPF
jgi:hypothetical protein